jgi:hypothetical protein
MPAMLFRVPAVAAMGRSFKVSSVIDRPFKQ